jgi:NAD(P)-dependent dehydrogenase (short-subunit alcohol dehydrogenase family)
LIASIEADGKQKIEISLREQVGLVRAEWEYQMADIRSFQEQAKAFEKALEIWGRIDYVYANAGMGEKSPWLATDSRSSEAFIAPDLSVGLAGLRSTQTHWDLDPGRRPHWNAVYRGLCRSAV